MTSYLRIRLKSKESKEIDRSGRRKFAEIDSNDPIGQVVYVIWVRSGFNGLPCSRSGRSKMEPSMIGDCVFLDIFSHFSPRRCGFPFSNLSDGWTHTERKSELIFVYIDRIETNATLG